MDLQTIFIIIVVVVIILVVLMGILSSRTAGTETWKLTLRSEFHKISNQSNSAQKLVELDKLMDFYLKNSGLKGETMGERLKNARKLFSRNDYNEIWEAHKMRNKLVHEIGQGNHNDLNSHISKYTKIISKL